MKSEDQIRASIEVFYQEIRLLKAKIDCLENILDEWDIYNQPIENKKIDVEMGK